MLDKYYSFIRNLTIRMKLIILFSSLIVFIAGFIYAYFPAKYESFAIHALQNKATSIATASAYSMAPALVFNDTKSIDEVIDGAKQNPDLLYMVVVDKNGQILSTYNFKYAADCHYKFIESELSGDEKFIKVSIPIMQGAEFYGRLYLALSTEEIQNTITVSRRSIGVISLFILGIGFLIVLVISKIIAKPLQVMLGTVKKISDGDLSQRAIIENNDEIGKLSSAFNSMVDNLEKAYSELDDLNKNLEQKVDLRTQELKIQIEEKLKSEQRLLDSESRLRKNVERGNILLQLYKDAPQLTARQLYEYVLKQAVYLSDSSIGFLYVPDELNKRIRLVAYNDDALPAFTKEVDYAVNEAGFLWECVHAQLPIIQNTVVDKTDFSGIPIGHTEFARYICVPALEDEQVGILFILANKAKNYDGQEVLPIQLVATEVSKILKQRWLDEQLRASENKYKDIFTHVQDVFYQVDIYGHITEISPSIERVSGYKREYLIGRKIEELYVNKNDRSYFLNILFESKEVTDWTVKIRSADQKVLYASVNAHLIYDENQEIIGYEGALRDITRRWLAEREVEQSTERFRQLYDEAPIGYCEIDKEGRILNANNAVFETLGYNRIKLIGQYVWEITDSVGLVRKEILAELSGKAKPIQNYERNFIHENGSIIPSLCEDRVLKNNRDEIIGLRTAFQDITQRKIVENELLIAKQSAEESNRLKSSFLANMSHELRTPMIGILGYSEILQNEPVDDSVKEIVKIVHKSANRLMNTLNLILDLSRIEAGKLELNISKVNVSNICRDICQLFDEAAKKKKLMLTCNTVQETLMLDTDESLLREIITNLVNNGIKYSEKGSVQVTLNTVSLHGIQYVQIKVMDTGIGIAEEDHEMIWEEFRQASEGMGRSFEGTGLGLTITKRFVEKLYGSIAVESKLGQGSTFTVMLPRFAFTAHDSYGEPAQESAMETTLISRVPSGKTAEILYVEDDVIAVDLVKRFLSDMCTIDYVMTSDDALNAVQQKKYDAILMDINLGKGRDGLDTTRLIKQFDTYKNVPIVAITAFAMLGDKEEFLAAGCSHYISKPFDKIELVSLMEKVLIKG